MVLKYFLINKKLEIYHKDNNMTKLSNEYMDQMTNISFNTLKKEPYSNLIDRNIVEVDNLPYLTFLIPFYKQCEYLITCVNSILVQNYPNIKIIIVNDAPTDEYIEFLNTTFKNIDVINIYHNEENLGASKTMMKCLELCDTEFAVKIDPDDFYIDKDFASKSINKLLEDEEISLVSYNSFLYLEDKNKITLNPLSYSGRMERFDYYTNFLHKYKKPNSSFPTVFRVKYFKPATLGKVGDTNIYLNSLLYGDAYIFEDIIGVYRFNTNSMTNNIPFYYMMDSIEEKYRLFKISTEVFERDMYKHYKKQIYTNLDFYISNNAKLTNIIDIANWTNNHGEISKYKIYIQSFKLWIKKYIYKIYKKIKGL